MYFAKAHAQKFVYSRNGNEGLKPKRCLMLIFQELISDIFLGHEKND